MALYDETGSLIDHNKLRPVTEDPSLLSLLETNKRLTDLLDEKEERIDELECDIERLELWADRKNFFRPRDMEASDLPSPRFQVDIKIHSEAEHEWTAFLVLDLGVHYSTGFPIMQTISRGSHRYTRFDSKEETRLSMPSGMHEIPRYMGSLGIPGFVNTPEGTYEMDAVFPANSDGGNDAS